MSQATKAYRERIGDMLIAAGLVTPAQVEEALQAQRATGVRLGKQLVSLGHVSELQLAQALSNQLSIPWVSLERIEFSRELLARVRGDIAERHSLMPIYIRSVREQGDTLYIAIEDPTDEVAIQQVGQSSGLPVRAMIAAPSDIRRAIDRHYFAEHPAPAIIAPGAGLREVLERAAESLHPTSLHTSTRLKVQPPPAPSSVPPPAPRIERIEPPAPPPAAVEARAPVREPKGESPSSARDSKPAANKPSIPPPLPSIPPASDPVVPLDEYDTPSKPPAGPQRTLTLLDGTQVALPASRSKRFAQEIVEVRQVVRAIRAAGADAGVEEAPTWHEVVQIVLEALAGRGLKLSRKDIAEAYIRVRERGTKTD